MNSRILAIVFGALSTLSAQSQVQSAGGLRGKVCDKSGKPIASATVIVGREGGDAKPLRSRTDADGSFTFRSLSVGDYDLQIAASGFSTAKLSSIHIGAKQKALNIILDSEKTKTATSSSGAPQFFDQPQFTVSGVTDTTNLGGHGSGPITRNREAVEKDVNALGGTPKAPVASPTAGAYGLALSYAKEGEYARARDQLRPLLEQHPTADVHHLLAEVDEKLGNSLDAVHEYQQAAELDPSESNMFDWGSELLLHHAAEPAIEVFTKGSRQFPNSTRLLIGLGAAEFAAGSSERADHRLCQATDLRPDDPLPYQFLGKIQRTDDTVPAGVVERFRRFLKLRPDNADANYLYAAALWKQNQPTPSPGVVKQSESLLETAIRLNPKFAEAYLQLGIVHMYQQNRAAAIADFQRATENWPELEEAHYRLAQAYRAAGRMDEARAEVETYQRLTRESAERIEREHREIQQFVYSLRDKSATQMP